MTSWLDKHQGSFLLSLYTPMPYLAWEIFETKSIDKHTYQIQKSTEILAPRYYE